MKIDNYREIVADLMHMIAKLEAEKNAYQTDIYMYVDERGHATLDTYINIGGNSWRDDDHILVWEDRPHYEDPADWAASLTTDEIADALISMNYWEYRGQIYAALDWCGIE